MKVFWVKDKGSAGIGWWGALSADRLTLTNFKPDFAIRMEFPDCVTPKFTNYNCTGTKHGVKKQSHESLAAAQKYLARAAEKLQAARER